MNIERIQKIHESTACPKSVSVMKALTQVWNECSHESGLEIKSLMESLEKTAQEKMELEKELAELKEFYNKSADLFVKWADFKMSDRLYSEKLSNLIGEVSVKLPQPEGGQCE